MIRHTVFFKVKPSVSSAAIETAFLQLFALQTQLPGILNITGGKCQFHENKGAGFITHGFSIDFVDDEAYHAFQHDPIAYPTKGCIFNIAVDGHQGIYGFDIGNILETPAPDYLEKHRRPVPRLVPKGAP